MKKKTIIGIIGSVGLICVVIILIVLGCFGGKKKSGKELSLEYLQDTYTSENDTFTYLNGGTTLFPGSHSEYRFESQKYNGSFTVKMTERDGKYSFEDDYHKLYMFDDALSYFKVAASTLNDYEIKIRFGNNYFDRYLTFDEYSAGSFDVYYITNHDFGEQKREAIVSKIAAELPDKTYMYVYFFVTNDRELLQSVDLDTILNNQSDYIQSITEYHIKTKDEFQKLILTK